MTVPISVRTPLAARAAAGLPGATVDIPMPPVEQAKYLLGIVSVPRALTEIRWRHGDGMRQLWFENPDEAAELAVAAGEQTDVYFGVHPRARRGGGKDSLLPGGGWVWAECDTEASVNRVLNMDDPPPLMVRSSRGKAHCYWPLLGGLRPWEMLERANRRLAWFLGADLRACDAARILRVPGTHNHKYPDKPRVGIVRFELTSNVLLGDLVGRLPDPTPPRPTPAPRVRLKDFGPDPDKDAILSVPARSWFERLTGRDVYHNMATCPFHSGGQERTPSFHVAGPQDTLWHCFGCDEGGDVFTFAAKLWGLDVERDFPAIKTKLKELL